MTDPVFALDPDLPRTLRFARWLIFRVLSGIRDGSLTLREGGQAFHFGDVSAELRADIDILSPTVYWRKSCGGGNLDGWRVGNATANTFTANICAQQYAAWTPGKRISSTWKTC